MYERILAWYTYPKSVYFIMYYLQLFDSIDCEVEAQRPRATTLELEARAVLEFGDIGNCRTSGTSANLAGTPPST